MLQGLSGLQDFRLPGIGIRTQVPGLHAAAQTLGSRNPTQTLEVEPGKGHFGYMENQMEKKMENEMETREYIGVILGLHGDNGKNMETTIEFLQSGP